MPTKSSTATTRSPDTAHRISLVLNAHTPFIPRTFSPHYNYEEIRFFESISGTFLPLLMLFDRLDADHVPFRLGIVLSPVLCCALQDEKLLRRYHEYTQRQIAFGEQESSRTTASPGQQKAARHFYDEVIEKSFLFNERYGRDLLTVFQHYQKKDCIELLMTSTTPAFLPFYVAKPEAMQAQIETAYMMYRRIFGNPGRGFMLPDCGWTPALDSFLHAYHITHTIVSTHGFLLGAPRPNFGIFFPVKTPEGISVFGQDPYSYQDISRFSRIGAYCNNASDIGFEMPAEQIPEFYDEAGGRIATGYRYFSHDQSLYNPEKAVRQAETHADQFLNARISHFKEVEQFTDESALSLCTITADSVGRDWYEGPVFLEALFRKAPAKRSIRFVCPSEASVTPHKTRSIPTFSSSGENGYAETWLDNANDWIYRHLMHSLDRMADLAERFPNETGIRERALNQAVWELLLAQSTDWATMLYRNERFDYAHEQIEQNLRNFTTIYEAFGGTRINTEWLTKLERRHPIVPEINYRVFRKKI
ncbi:glycoside hydrolase family protein [Spirochaetia bacterium]|nr:glycoside hydrolase family protein [Spirochaetia bacterium]GHU32286.1 glycoside hydrolase family protein [Spirochaetia bacterium]